MSGVWIYRAATSLLAAGASPLRRLGPLESPWRAGWQAESPETERAAGSIWVHAASLGEVASAGRWIEALLAEGNRSPILLTTRTSAGLARARRELPGRVAARIAPHDLPPVLAGFLASAVPRRLDVIETEIWPNMIVEAGRRSVAVVFVSAAVTQRTASRLLLLGLAGRGLLGQGVYVLAQTETHAARFRALGAPAERVCVIGDLKADLLPAGAPAPFGPRPAIVFGSLRPGEERTAVRLAQVVERHRVGFGAERIAWAAARGVRDPLEGRCRPVLLVAPRHRRADRAVAAALRSRGFHVDVRDEAARSRLDLRQWIEELSRGPGGRVGLLATHGELASAYEAAWAAVIGGTFAPYGGHSLWEPASRACPLLVGPHHEEVLAGVEAVVREGAGVVVADDGRHLEHVLGGWLTDQDLDQRAAAARRAVEGASGASARGIAALDAWGLDR